MKIEIVLCVGMKGIFFVIIKIEMVECFNLKNYGGGKEGKWSDYKLIVLIILFCIDVLWELV